MGQATDAELWRRAVEGEPDAFGALFERHARAVYNYLFRRTAEWSLAEDLTSVVFLEAWRRRSDVRLERELALPWLLGVATNVLRNRRRSQWRYRAALERLPRERGEDFADDANGRLDDERRMRVVLRSLGKLPKREQDVIALCAWADLSYEEAAAALDVPVGTVRSRLSRARARLREPDGPGGHEGDGKRAVPAEEA
jgi:RNA polymerase sigma-70 factor, ECF subfamily